MDESRCSNRSSQTTKARVGPVEYWVVRILPPILLLVAAGCVGFGIHANRNMGPPRDEFVRQTTAAWSEVSSPEEAEARIPGCGTIRYSNGEWVTGVGADGHSWKRAKDTFVCRDSRGRVKAYVGHVCGPDWMPRAFPTYRSDFRSLEDFYAYLKEAGFEEYSTGC